VRDGRALGVHFMQLDALAKNIDESYLRDLDGLLAPEVSSP
jgi:hypothetical protein